MFLHSLHPSSVLFSFGPFAVHWYGLLLVAGGIAAYSVSRKTFSWAGVPRAVLDELLAPLVIAGFIGARLYHVLNELDFYLAQPLDVFAVWRGGLAIHGALIGGVLVLWWYAGTKERKDERADNIVTHERRYARSVVLQFFSSSVLQPFLYIADLLAPGLALAQAIGRWGNYFNQELYGKPTDSAWGIPIDFAKRVTGFGQYEYFHPTFLYESAWLMVVCIILLCLLWRRVKPTPSFFASPSTGGEPSLERGGSMKPGQGVLAPGRIFFLYLILAGFGRFFIEFLRIDAMPLVAGVRLQQLVSLFMIIMGISGIIWNMLPRTRPAP